MKYELKTLVDTLKPMTFVYNFRDENPPRIDAFLDVGAKMRTGGKCTLLTFWFRWDHDWEGDGVEDWEPVTYVLKKDEVVDIQTRPHWNIVKWLTDEPILEDGKRAIVYFSKHGHAPYLQVRPRTEVGWLKNAMYKIKTRVAILDFLEVMDERGQYVNIRDYKVIEEREPPSTSKAMKGIEILGIRLFSKWYEIPETC